MRVSSSINSWLHHKSFHYLYCTVGTERCCLVLFRVLYTDGVSKNFLSKMLFSGLRALSNMFYVLLSCFIFCYLLCFLYMFHSRLNCVTIHWINAQFITLYGTKLMPHVIFCPSTIVYSEGHGKWFENN